MLQPQLNSAMPKPNQTKPPRLKNALPYHAVLSSCQNADLRQRLNVGWVHHHRIRTDLAEIRNPGVKKKKEKIKNSQVK